MGLFNRLKTDKLKEIDEFISEPSEGLFKCNICGMLSKDQLAMRKHVIVTKKNADEYFYPLVFNSKNNMRHGKSVWVSEADEYWTYYKIRDVKFGKLYRRQFNIRRQK